MAQNLQLLKRRINTAKNIAQLSRAMEMVSASKIKKAQKTVENYRPYYERIRDLTGSILRHVDMDQFNHPYVQDKKSGKTLIIAISPDKGLCGSLNTNLFKLLLAQDSRNLKIAAMGRRIKQFASRLEGELLADFNMGTSIPSYSIVFQLIEIINDEFIKGDVSRVQILYTHFNSIFSQAPVVRDILPIKESHEEGELPFTFEPKPEILLSDLLPYLVEVTLYSSIIEAFTSEQAARMVAMQNAKNNALDIADYLTLSYNKSRQERITNELLSLNSA